MRLSSGKINNLLGVPSNPEPGEFYLIEYSGITQLYFSNTSSELILLNEYATNVTVGDGEIVFGGAGNTLLSDPDFTFASGVLSVDSVLVQDEVYGVGWNASLGVPTKNAIYDKIESLSFSIPDGDKGDITVSSAGSTWTIDAQNSAFWRGKVSDETGSGAWVFNDTPSLIAPLLGTPTSGNLSNCTALPISTGVSGLGANVATFLATPSSANLYSALTTKTGTGSNVFANATLLSGAVVLSSGSLYLTGASNTAATSLDGLVLEAGNLADATHDYWSPALRMTGSSYRTTGGLSDYAEFKTEVQAVTHLTQFNNFGNYVISSGVTDTAPGASTFTPIFTLSSLGALSIVGDVTAPTFIGALTGNASTATALQNARTIGGVSFNGTANIVPQTIQSVNEATDTTCFPLFISASGSQSLQPLNNAGFTYNSATNALTATTFIGALTGNASTATALANARTIGGVSFDGTANITVVSATGDFNVTSKLGVGVTATKTLHVQGPNTTSSYYAIFQNSSGLQPFTIQGDGNVNIGATASSANNSRLYVYGGGNGANVDVRGVSGATTDQAIIELEGNDYDTQTKSAYLLFRGSTFTGSYMGFTNANLGLLMFNGDTSVIGTLNTDIIFAPNFGERARIKTDGTFVTNGTVGLTGTRVSKGWFTDVESTNMYTVGGVSLNSTFQPLDSDLTTIAGLTATTDNFIVSVASAWASRTPAQVKTTLSLNNVENTALSTWAGTANITTLGTISTGTWQGGVISSTYGGTGVNNGGRTLTLNTNSGTIAFSAASKTVTFAKTLTFDGTDGTTMTFPSTTATIARTDAGQTFTGTQTFSSTISGSISGSAPTLTTARAIYGNNFDGSAALSQIIASTYGGTGNGFTKFSGPTTSEKTFTLPNATATILTDNAAVTVAQGGTGRATSTTAYGLLAAGTTATGAHQTLAAGATTEILVGGGASALPVWTTATGSGSPVRGTSPTVASPTLSGTTTISNANGAGYEATISGSVSSPYDVLTLTSKGGSGGWGGQINFDVSYSGGATGTVFQIKGTGTTGKANSSFGGAADRSVTNGESVVSIFNGTAPSGTLTNGASFYCASGEMRVMDSAGNSTLLSPHDKDGNWIHDEINYKGRRLRVDMERLIKAIDKLLGGGFVEEFEIEDK